QYQEGIINKEKKSILSESLKVVDLAEQNAPDYHVNDVICIDIKECYPAIAVNRELPEDDITRFVQIRSFKFASNIYSAISVWYGKHFAYRSGEGCGKEKDEHL
ncbi:15362_t:CDS:2, partial [Racocetra persica]